MLDQAVIDMKSDLLKMKEASNEVLATQKSLEDKFRSATAASASWLQRAELALSKGEEELAREALKRRQSFQVRGLKFVCQNSRSSDFFIWDVVSSQVPFYGNISLPYQWLKLWQVTANSRICWDQATADTLRKQLDIHTRASNTLLGNIRLLENKVSEAVSKKETLKARALTAQVRILWCISHVLMGVFRLRSWFE